MPCEVVLYKVDFFKMAAVAMEMAKRKSTKGQTTIDKAIHIKLKSE
jgi:hypothetical protein